MVAGIIFAGAPGVELRLGGRIQRRREGDDRPHVQVGVGPSVQPSANPRRKRVVDRRVAERARDADAGELTRVVDLPLDADDRIQPQQFDGHGGVGQINLAGPQRGDDCPRQGLDVDLEAHGQRGRRGDRRNDLVHPQHVGPQLLVAEGVVAEDGLPISMFPLPSSRCLSPSSERLARLICGDGRGEPCDGERHREREYD